MEELIKFDPVVRLFFDAILFRYDDVFNHHAECKKEVMHNLGERLIPDEFYSAMPAFGVLQAAPAKNEVYKLRNDTIFSSTRKLKDKIVDVNYIPLDESELIPGEIDAVIVNRFFVDFRAKEKGDVDSYITRLESGDENTIWFRISLPDRVKESLEKITFYFEYDVSDYEQGLYFDELAHAHWYMDGNPLEVYCGFPHTTRIDHPSTNKRSIYKSRQRIYDFYRKNFISLTKTDQSHDSSDLPVLPLGATGDKGNHVWVAARCNAAIPMGFITGNIFSINAFPVMNCDIKSDALTSAEIIKGIRLGEYEFYLGLWDAEGIDSEDFIVRNSRYKSFDSKDLAFEIRTLIRLYNHSRSSFSKENNIDEGEIEIIRKFSDILADLELQHKNIHVTPHFGISAREPFERIKNYKYLTTFGALGNGGEAGELLKCNKPGLNDKSILALTSFDGGMNLLDEEQTVDHFRYLLLSRDRIVTRQDIKALCYAVFGEGNLEQVKLTNSSIQGLGETGLRRAIRIELELKATARRDQSKTEFCKRELLTILQNKSMDNRAFVIRITRQQDKSL